MKALLTGILCLVVSFSYGQMIKLGGLTASRYDIHIVEKGETLYSISKSFNTTKSELLKLNPDIHNNQLEEGRVINVPVSRVVLNTTPSHGDYLRDNAEEELVFVSDEKEGNAISPSDIIMH